LAPGKGLLDLVVDVFAVNRLMLLDRLAATCIWQDATLPDDLGCTAWMSNDRDAGAA